MNMPRDDNSFIMPFQGDLMVDLFIKAYILLGVQIKKFAQS